MSESYPKEETILAPKAVTPPLFSRNRSSVSLPLFPVSGSDSLADVNTSSHKHKTPNLQIPQSFPHLSPLELPQFSSTTHILPASLDEDLSFLIVEPSLRGTRGIGNEKEDYETPNDGPGTSEKIPAYESVSECKRRRRRRRRELTSISKERANLLQNLIHNSRLRRTQKKYQSPSTCTFVTTASSASERVEDGSESGRTRSRVEKLVHFFDTTES